MSRRFNGVEPIRREVFPIPIHRRNQRVLFLASPALELFLPRDCMTDFAEVFVIDQMNAVLTLRKTIRTLPDAMLPKANAQFARDSDVQRRTRIVCDDVDPIVV